MHGMPDEKLLSYIKHMTETMTFCAKKFGEVLGIRIVQPYLDPRVIKFAKSCMSRGELIQPVQIPDTDTGKTKKQALHGKMVLRLAFPEATSCWRKKDPIEQGSGTTILPQLLQDEADDSFEMVQKNVLEKYSIKIRDPEHLYYFKAFQRVFGTDLDCAIERNGSDPCIGCGFQLPDNKTMFCKVCGAWPARETETK
jgi:asparagine synthase (glutamine-hydrolysing)